MGNSCLPGCRWWCLWWRLFVLSFFPRKVLDEILDLIESVSEGFPTYSYNASIYGWIENQSFHVHSSYLIVLSVDPFSSEIVTDVISFVQGRTFVFGRVADAKVLYHWILSKSFPHMLFFLQHFSRPLFCCSYLKIEYWYFLLPHLEKINKHVQFQTVQSW